MALINCPECSTQVSSAAESCPKCGFPVAESVAATLENQPPKTGKRKLALVLTMGALVLLIADRCHRTSTGTTAWPAAATPVREVPRENSRAWCRDVVHGVAPSLRNLLGTPTVAVQAGLLSTMSCKGTPEGFSCVMENGSPYELRVSDRDKVRGFRLKFTEEPVQGFAAPGCCDGVAEAAEMYRRAKFNRYGRDCSLTFGRFPP
jgi:hypothetical protein